MKQAKSLNIAGEQLAELKERGEAAERDLGATLDKAYELVLLPVAREGDRGAVRLRGDRLERSPRARPTSTRSG